MNAIAKYVGIILFTICITYQIVCLSEKYFTFSTKTSVIIKTEFKTVQENELPSITNCTKGEFQYFKSNKISKCIFMFNQKQFQKLHFSCRRIKK